MGVFEVADKIAKEAERLYKKKYNVTYWNTGSRKSAYIRSEGSKQVVRVSDHRPSFSNRYRQQTCFSVDYRNKDQQIVGLQYLGR